jgi:hypothetical protein
MRPFHASMIVVFCMSDNAVKEDVLYEKELRSRRQLYLEKLVMAGSDTSKGSECNLPSLIDINVKIHCQKMTLLTY